MLINGSCFCFKYMFDCKMWCFFFIAVHDVFMWVFDVEFHNLLKKLPMFLVLLLSIVSYISYTLICFKISMFLFVAPIVTTVA